MSATTQEEQKRAVGRAAVRYVESGMVLGVGTGTTAAHFIAGLIEARPAVKAFVASSERSAVALRAAGLEVTDLDVAGPVDLYIDGADEIDPSFRMIKGGGGAHTERRSSPPPRASSSASSMRASWSTSSAHSRCRWRSSLWPRVW